MSKSTIARRFFAIHFCFVKSAATPDRLSTGNEAKQLLQSEAGLSMKRDTRERNREEVKSRLKHRMSQDIYVS